MKPVSRGAIFWGAALVTGGLTVLLIQQELISAEFINEAARWWPLILIGAGVAIIFAGALGAVATGLAGVLLGALVGGLIAGGPVLSAGCGPGDPGPLQPFADGDFGTRQVEVDLDLNCVTLDVTTTDSETAWSVEAAEDTADDLDLNSDSDGFSLRTEEPVTVGFGERRAVAVNLPSSPGLDLEASLNAGEATFDFADAALGLVDVEGNAVALTFDLSDATIDSVRIGMNAGAASVQLSSGSEIGLLDLSANAGAMEVCAGPDVGLQITMGDNMTVGHNLEDEGLDQDGDVWRTPDYASAATQIEITFEGNAAAFTLNPEGGCS